MIQTDLSVRIGGLTLKNPVMPASGTYDYFDCNANVFPMSELGAIVIKSVHRFHRNGNPSPRIVETVGGMINAVGIPSRGIESFMSDELNHYCELATPIVLSLSGSQAEDYEGSAEIVANDTRIAALELNLSCPNVGSGLPFSSDPALLTDVVTRVRKKTDLPLLVKLTPNVTDICPTAKAAEDAGADGLVLSNTFRAMAIDIQKRRPVLGNISGGLSGPAIKPQNLFLVYHAYHAVKIPIIACGGISCWQDAVEYFLAGATAVQVGCCNFRNPKCMIEVINGIDQYLKDNGFSSLAEIRGLAHQSL